MDPAAVAQVRSFNRLVTQRVGALNDRYLARNLPLGEARVLWEIGHDGCELRRLRTRLGLDSGYLSRLLRALERAGLVRVERDDDDGHARTARLTPEGRAERALLDRRSDDLARSLLGPLGGSQRERLVAAMAAVERLLTAGLVEIGPFDPSAPAAQRCLGEYYAELATRFEAGFDPGRSISAEAHELSPPAGVFLLATLQGDAIGCGAVKFHGGEPAEIKRMWVDRRVRGLGVGHRLLDELERSARSNGARVTRLETNGALGEAIALYRSAGYREVAAFNDEPYAHHWFEKQLLPTPGGPKENAKR